MHNSVELTSPGEVAVASEVRSAGPFDLVVANDARALPLAFAAADGAPVFADMHEWAPEERATVFVWKVLVGPYMAHLCRKYLPRASAVTSVSSGLANLYSKQFGVATELVRSSADFRDLKPSPVEPDLIRLVHSGTADPERNILELVDAVEKLGAGFSLDLYLVEVPGGHLEVIRKRIMHSPNVTLHHPVPPEDLPGTLNQYDLGVFLYPLRTLSHLYHLPNKFFDFVQARLGLVFSPAPEIEFYFEKFGIGILTRDTTSQALVEALQNITTADVNRLKDASDKAARALSSDSDKKTESEIVSRLLAGSR